MFGGLYGDLPEAKQGSGKSTSDTARWAQKPAYAPPLRRPAPSSVSKSASNAKKSVRPADGRVLGDSGAGPSAPGMGSGLLGSANKDEQFKDEYDPAKPNDYEAIRSQREKDTHQAQEEADRQEELRLLQEQDRKANEANEKLSHQVRPEDRDSVLALSGEEAFLRRGRLGKPGNEETGSDAEGSSFASRMMQKMGWKEGLGLGKAHQGITTHLEHQKTDKAVGVIRHAAPRANGAEGPPEKKAKGVIIQGTPSRVVLLRNIVGPGEVDDSLEDEIGEECSKHGPVSQIAIFEATEPNFPPDKAVRIFVQFERMESAMKAAIALEGRFFGGRTVKAMFFSEDKFDRRDLAPVPGEPD